MADIFQTLDRQGADVVRAVADRLEFRGTAPAFVAMRDRYLERMDLGRYARALDMGGGTFFGSCNFCSYLLHKPG